MIVIAVTDQVRNTATMTPDDAALVQLQWYEGNFRNKAK